jgi:hypothetical protein
MFDRISAAAERLATNVSRRAFLGRLGQGALGLAALIGGVLAFPGDAQAAGKKNCYCCKPFGGLGSLGCYTTPPRPYCWLVKEHCANCHGPC